MANHKADRREATRDESAPRRPTAPGGRRKAVKQARSPRTQVLEAAAHAGTHAGLRRNLIPGLPSAPTLAGAAVLAIAAAGAVTMGGHASVPDRASEFSAQASVLTGVSAVSTKAAEEDRELAVSRDSERMALQDAADQKLQAAAEAQAKERNAALAELAASAEKHADAIAKNAWQLPVTSGVYHLTARFGEVSGLWAHTHTGLDFAAPTGTEIHAVAGGVVTEVGYSGAYGNRTIVTLDDGTELWYCHQNAVAVSSGDTVVAGQLIGYVGSTGNVTGPHLHLEVRPGAGDPVDPYAALQVHGLQP